MGDYRDDHRRGGCLPFMGAITIGLIVIISGLYLWVDTSCISGADRWLNDYPASQFIDEDYSFIRPFGIGETTRILYSEHSLNTVRNWYFDEDRNRNRRGLNRGDGVAWMRWYVQEADNDSTIIILKSECSRQWVLWD